MKSTATLYSDSFKSFIDNGRTHAVITDLPKPKKGEDLAPTALELTVMALSGCITTIFAVVASNSNVSFDSIKVELDAEKPDDAPTITSTKAKVTVKSSEEEGKIQRCLDKTLKTCPVGQLYEKAGVQVETELTVVQ